MLFKFSRFCYIGAVYAFRSSFSFSWSNDQVLQASDPRSGSRFGHSLSLYEDQLVVGTISIVYDFPGVYLFRADSQSFWKQIYRVEPVLPGPGDHFGRAVSLFEDHLAVGASGNDDAGANAGSKTALYKRIPRFKLNSTLNIRKSVHVRLLYTTHWYTNWNTFDVANCHTFWRSHISTNE